MENDLEVAEQKIRERAFLMAIDLKIREKTSVDVSKRKVVFLNDVLFVLGATKEEFREFDYGKWMKENEFSESCYPIKRFVEKEILGKKKEA